MDCNERQTDTARSTVRLASLGAAAAGVALSASIDYTDMAPTKSIYPTARAPLNGVHKSVRPKRLAMSFRFRPPYSGPEGPRFVPMTAARVRSSKARLVTANVTRSSSVALAWRMIQKPITARVRLESLRTDYTRETGSSLLISNTGE